MGLERRSGLAVRTLNLRREALQRAALAEIADALLPEIEINEYLDPFGAVLGAQSLDRLTQLVDAGHHGFLESRLLGRAVAIQGAGRDLSFLGQAVDADPPITSLAKAAADRGKDSRLGFLLVSGCISRHVGLFYITIA